MSKGIGRYVALTAAIFVLSTAPAWATAVELELLLLVDVSGSISSSEYALQKDGYASAFQDPGIHSQIASYSDGIAVAYAEWSDANQQALLVGWTHLTDAASSNAFAGLIAGSTRAFDDNTAPGSAINWGVPLFNNTFEGTRLVIDISGDGVQNRGDDTYDAAWAANHTSGITVNGLAIGGSSSVESFYLNSITNPGGGTLYTAANFGDFEDAISDKIRREINPIPEPATLLLLGGGLFGLGLRRSRRRG